MIMIMKMKMKICPVCGEQFNPNSASQKYCSPKCARDAATEKNYDRILFRNASKAKQNPYLLYAYGFSCGMCGWKLSDKLSILETERQNGCEFHHIIPVSRGGTNDEDNLILLCPNCHKKAHAGLLSYEELKAHTKTKEEGMAARERCAQILGCGTYHVDDFVLNRARTIKKLK